MAIAKAIVERHGSLVHALGRAITTDPDDADDLFLRTFDRLLTGDDEVNRLAAARAWATWEGRTATLLRKRLREFERRIEKKMEQARERESLRESTLQAALYDLYGKVDAKNDTPVTELVPLK